MPIVDFVGAAAAAIRDRNRYSCVKRENGDGERIPPSKWRAQHAPRSIVGYESSVAAAAHHDRLPSERSTISLSKWREFDYRLPSRTTRRFARSKYHRPHSPSLLFFRSLNVYI